MATVCMLVVVLESTLFINKYMPSSNTCCDDGVGDFEDFAELYNSGSQPIDMGGMYVSDDLTDLMQAQIPDDQHGGTTIPAGGFLVIFFNGHPDQGPLHVQPNCPAAVRMLYSLLRMKRPSLMLRYLKRLKKMFPPVGHRVAVITGFYTPYPTPVYQIRKFRMHILLKY